MDGPQDRGQGPGVPLSVYPDSGEPVYGGHETLPGLEGRILVPTEHQSFEIERPWITKEIGREEPKGVISKNKI